MLLSTEYSAVPTKLLTVAYLPPPSLPYAAPFLRNIRAHRNKHDLLLFSDCDWPDVKRIKGSPECVKGHTSFAVSNLIFYTGMSLAEQAGATHVLYVEADSRVFGDAWDAKIFDEFLQRPRVPAIIGGSVAVHNPCNAGREAALRWEELVASNVRKNFPIATHIHVPVLAFGNKGSADKADSCVFCYGSGTVIDMQWYKLLFSEAERRPELQEDTGGHQFGMTTRREVPQADPEGFAFAQLAKNTRPWDLELGIRIWSRFGPDSYDVIANLPSVFSSYGSVITSEEERLGMLRDGSRSLIHQCKSNAEV